MKFKIGDKVRLLGTKSYGNPFDDPYYKYHKGDIYEVSVLYEDGCISFNTNGSGVFRECDVELATKEITDWSKEFK